ncbi:hypothetical protein ACI65C_001398 [Semiaphis heraclei]
MNTNPNIYTPTEVPIPVGASRDWSDRGVQSGACDGNSHRAVLSGPSKDTPYKRSAAATSVGDTASFLPPIRKRTGRWATWRLRRDRKSPRNTSNAGDSPSPGTQNIGGLVISVAESGSTSSTEATLIRGTTRTDGSTADSDSDSLVRPVVTLPSKPIKVIQINAARSKYVTHQIENLLVKNNIDVCLIQEPATDNRGVYLLDRYPYKVIANGHNPKAAIVVANPAIGVLALSQLGTSHFAAGVLTVGTFRLTLISAYFQFSEPTRSYADALESILDRVNGGVLICADVNARSAVWHDCISDDRGDIVVDMISRKNLEVINRVGFPPTFRNRGSACLDVTLASNSVRAVDWSAVHDLTSSDHAVISFEILASDARPKEGTPKSARYDWSRTNWIEFRKTLKSEANSRAGELECPDADTCAKALSEVLTQACETHMRRPVAGKHRTPPWWNRDLERELSTLGRWKKGRAKKNCFKARRDSWRSFVTETGNRNPWGPVYKWLKSGGSRPSERIPASIRTADGSFTSTLLETGERLMEALVLSDTAENESAEQIAIREETGVSLGEFKPASPETAAEFVPPAACDVEEVKMAIWRMKPKKAPGLDGITAGILRQAWPVLSQQITHAFNACLRSNKFPNCWKRAAVVVIKKSSDKDPSEAKSYRPISLLPVLSKALEHIIVARIREDTASQMSGRQYGFTKNLSTVDAMHHALQWADSRREKYVVAVFLDISGAFDCLWWPQLVKDLESAKCRSSLIELTKSYLDGRQATMVIGDQTVTKSLNKGCPQGSEYGPDLWKMKKENRSKRNSTQNCTWMYSTYQTRAGAYVDHKCVHLELAHVNMAQST